MTALPPEPTADEDEEKPPEKVYGPTDGFVRKHLQHGYRRQTSEHRVWAARW